MVTIKKKLFGFTLTENWFEYKPQWTDLFLPVCYRGIREDGQNFRFGVKKPTTTLELDLKRTEEEIFEGFTSSVKRDVKKGMNEGIECYFHNDKDSFITFYNDFAKSRNLFGIDAKRQDEIGKEWTFSYAALNGEVLAAHSYMEDKATGIVRSMHSGSRRLDENYNSHLIARANRLLHFYDMKEFSTRGFKYYDFGGWNDIPGLLDFKMSFGSAKKDILNYFTYTYHLKELLMKK
jgi:lipid II:glycine glycyltransferase (peptidoglycan interpeptide bridge formation enzyme)